MKYSKKYYLIKKVLKGHKENPQYRNGPKNYEILFPLQMILILLGDYVMTKKDLINKVSDDNLKNSIFGKDGTINTFYTIINFYNDRDYKIGKILEFSKEVFGNEKIMLTKQAMIFDGSDSQKDLVEFSVLIKFVFE